MKGKIMDNKNLIVMKLLHYFITDKNYNPIILQGAENEIWLENLDSDYKIVRIVSNYIHNNEQLDFDIFKTKRVVKKIKRKTLSLNMNVLSIFIDLGDSVNLENENEKNIDCILLKDEKDIKKYDVLNVTFPDMKKKLKFTEEGLQLFVKITEDINRKNKNDAERAEEVFSPKMPLITYILIGINILVFVMMLLGGEETIIETYGTYGPYIRLGEYYRLLTGAFLHANLVHLMFNCYALYIIGSQLESFIGKWKYLVIYLFSAITGSLLSISFGNHISVGASGAIFGLMGSLLYFGYHYRVYLGSVIRSQIIPLIIFNLFFGFIMTGVDNAAHIGGLIGGIAMTIAVGVKYKSTTFERVNGCIVTAILLAFLYYIAFVIAA